MLSKPFLAKCSDRNLLPLAHPTSGSPESWFSDERLMPHGLRSIAFDFFVNWSTPLARLTPVIWIKRILEPHYTYDHVIQNIHDVLIHEFGSRYLNSLKSFAHTHNLQVQFIIFKDNLDWSVFTGEILLVSLAADNSCDLVFDHTLITVEHLKTLIKTHSGGPIKIGRKGLIYGTSNLECYLSRTDSLYPGDVDQIILDIENRPVCMLEFKKHTLSDPIENQRLSKYYPNPDGRKYDRLAVLRDHIGNVPVFIFYYPTRAQFSKGKFEIIGGNIGNLLSTRSGYFDLPTNDSTEEIDKMTAVLLQILKTSHK